jgi:hypothetical protein
MDDELLPQLYQRLLRDRNYRLEQAAGRRRTFCDALIALVYLYAVLCDRSPRWASDLRHWPWWCRRLLVLPSYSQLMRRLKTAAVRRLIAQVSGDLRLQLPRSPQKVIDGKPLLVGGFSKDPDAALGVVPDGWGHGYRLHLIVDAASAAVESFLLTALDAGEATVALDLVQRAELQGTVLLGDPNYDSNRLYAALADAGGRLLAPRKKPGRGLGHHAHHPDRLAAIALLENPLDRSAARATRRMRNRIEQSLAHLTNLPCGLSPLPNFVRRFWRVRLWVSAKILLYHQHMVLRQSLTGPA